MRGCQRPEKGHPSPVRRRPEFMARPPKKNCPANIYRSVLPKIYEKFFSGGAETSPRALPGPAPGPGPDRTRTPRTGAIGGKLYVCTSAPSFVPGEFKTFDHNGRRKNITLTFLMKTSPAVAVAVAPGIFIVRGRGWSPDNRRTGSRDRYDTYIHPRRFGVVHNNDNNS